VLRRLLLEFCPADVAPGADAVWSAARAFCRDLPQSAVACNRQRRADNRAYITVTYATGQAAEAAAAAFRQRPHELLGLRHSRGSIRAKLVPADGAGARGGGGGGGSGSSGHSNANNAANGHRPRHEHEYG
jgi:hypothetical protein